MILATLVSLSTAPCLPRGSLALVRRHVGGDMTTRWRHGDPRAQASGDDADMDDDLNEQLFLADLEVALTQPRSPQFSGDEPTLLRVQQRRRRRQGQPARRRRGPAPAFTREETQLANLPSTLRRAYDDFLERPGQPLILGSLALLVGFYLAGALSTVFGAAGFWEPTIALGPLTLTELITRRYYSRPMSERSQTLRLLNALKVGFLFGVVLDALKLAG